MKKVLLAMALVMVLPFSAFATDKQGIREVDSESFPHEGNWQIEEKAADAFVESVNSAFQQLQRQLGHVLKDKEKLSTTLSPKDFSWGNTQIGKRAVPSSEVQWSRWEDNLFRSYSQDGVKVKLYTGPTEENSDTLRRQGLPYHFKSEEIVAIEATSGKEKTPRDIGIGAYRGEVLYAYGAPQTVWYLPKKNETIFVYTADKEANKDTSYLFFTLKDSQVSKVSILNHQIVSKYSMPAVTPNFFIAGPLQEADFKLMNQELHKVFHEPKNMEWTVKGILNDEPFVGYGAFIVVYDKRHVVTRVILNKDAVTTPRGVGIGDTKFVLLSTYGLPDYIEEASADTTTDGKAEKKEIYIYKNPKEADSYLRFTILAKDNFIKSIDLSSKRKYD